MDDLREVIIGYITLPLNTPCCSSVFLLLTCVKSKNTQRGCLPGNDISDKQMTPKVAIYPGDQSGRGGNYRSAN